MTWRFADCVLDPERRDLQRASAPVALTPKVFDLLVFLLRQRHRVVSRDELIEHVWAGRNVSESTVASHINALRNAVGDDGVRQQVIKTAPRKGFRFVAEVTEMAAEPQLQESLQTPWFASSTAGHDAPQMALHDLAPQAVALPDKASIAVLPFANLNGDPEQDYLADGVVEDVITALSRHRWLFVVARNSSFTYKHRSVDVKQMGRELGVRYLLQGSWRHAQGRVRMTSHLVDTELGKTHWAGRFEGVIENIFDFQDQLTESVVGAISPELELAEIERVRFQSTENLGAYDRYWRGMFQLHKGTREGIDQALPEFYQACAIDADYASAHAMAAWSYCWRKINCWMTEPEREIEEGVRLARRAIALGKYDAVALSRGGHALGHLTGDLQESMALVKQAQELNPNLSSAWFLGAFCHLWAGQTEQAIAQFGHAMRLSPVDPEFFRMQVGMAVARYMQQEFAEAQDWAERVIRQVPELLVAQAILAASQAMQGDAVAARQTMAKLTSLTPSLQLGNLQTWLPLKSSRDWDLMLAGLEKAGLRA